MAKGDIVRVNLGDAFDVNMMLIGDAELERVFTSLPDVIQRKALRPALRDALKIIKPVVQALAPKPSLAGRALRGRALRAALRPGQTKHLAQSFRIRAWNTRSRNRIKFALQSGRREELGIPWPKYRGYYPTHLELGYRRGGRVFPGRSYMRTAFHANRSRMVDAVTNRLRSEIERMRPA